MVFVRETTAFCRVRAKILRQYKIEIRIYETFSPRYEFKNKNLSFTDGIIIMKFFRSIPSGPTCYSCTINACNSCSTHTHIQLNTAKLLITIIEIRANNIRYDNDVVY